MAYLLGRPGASRSSSDAQQDCVARAYSHSLVVYVLHSSEVQIALFTARIKHITAHVIANPKDHATRRGLLSLVSKRRRLLHYLYARSPEKATKLTADLGVRFRFRSKLPDRAEKYRAYTILANKTRK